MNYDWLSSNKDTLIYIGDTMCSWCYGMTTELDKLKANHTNLDFRLIMGGLRPFNTEKIVAMSDFLKAHWLEIEKRTGQSFSYKILEDAAFIYDTEPASRAVIVARQMNFNIEYDFFKGVQLAFYKLNEDTTKLETFLKLADQFNLNSSEFENLFQSTAIKEQTKNDFKLSKQMGIKGFPSIVLKKDKEFTLIANGYQTAEKIEEIITSLV